MIPLGQSKPQNIEQSGLVAQGILGHMRASRSLSLTSFLSAAMIVATAFI